MVVLGVETSCDETSAAVIRGDTVLSNVISSQEIHSRFGGVVPELASRAHIRLVVPMVREAMKEAQLDFTDLDGLAVTHGPGLVGALLVGVNFIKGLALALDRPFIGVNHIEGHIYGNILSQQTFEFPVLFLIISGGHTQLVLMKDHLQYKIIGTTRDDAVGEAFDKGAKLLGLGYPGGPEIDKRALNGDSTFYPFPQALARDKGYEFSYSGLKTSLLTYLQDKDKSFLQEHLDDICASYQFAAVEILIKKTMRAAREFHINNIAIAGGVAANSRLRKRLEEECRHNNRHLYLPDMQFCTDNAAMIARAGLEYLRNGFYSEQNLNAYPSLALQSVTTF